MSLFTTMEYKAKNMINPYRIIVNIFFALSFSICLDSFANVDDRFLAYIADEEDLDHYKNTYIHGPVSFNQSIEELIAQGKIKTLDNQLFEEMTLEYPFIMELERSHFITSYSTSNEVENMIGVSDEGEKNQSDTKPLLQTLTRINHENSSTDGVNQIRLTNSGIKNKPDTMFVKLDEGFPESELRLNHIDSHRHFAASTKHKIYVCADNFNEYSFLEKLFDKDWINNSVLTNEVIEWITESLEENNYYGYEVIDIEESMFISVGDKYQYENINIINSVSMNDDIHVSISLQNFIDDTILSESKIKEIINIWSTSEGYFDIKINSIEKIVDADNQNVSFNVNVESLIPTKLSEIHFSNSGMKSNNDYWLKMAGLYPGVVLNNKTLNKLDEVLVSEGINEFTIDVIDVEGKKNNKSVLIDSNSKETLVSDLFFSYDEINSFQVGSSINLTNLLSLEDKLSFTYQPGSSSAFSKIEYEDRNVFSLYDQLQVSMLSGTTDYIAFSDKYDEYSISYDFPSTNISKYFTLGLSYLNIEDFALLDDIQPKKEYSARYINPRLMLSGKFSSVVDVIDTQYSISLSSNTSIDKRYGDFVSASFELSNTFSGMENLGVKTGYIFRSYLDNQPVPNRFRLLNSGFFRNRGIADYSLVPLEGAPSTSISHHEHQIAFKIENKIFDLPAFGSEINAFMDHNYIHRGVVSGSENFTSIGFSLRLIDIGMPIEISIANLLGSNNSGTFLTISAIQI